jgi:hypothetical protein
VRRERSSAPTAAKPRGIKAEVGVCRQGEPPVALIERGKLDAIL